MPNLNQAQCLAKAQQLALDISRHERYARVIIPSLALMSPQTLIPVSGTGTDYDSTYFPLTITYEVTTERGATTFVEATVSSPLGIYDGETGQRLDGKSADYAVGSGGWTAPGNGLDSGFVECCRFSR